MPYTPSQRKALDEAKSRMARALTEAGAPSLFWEPTRALSTRAARVFGPRNPAESTTDYFNRMAGQAPRAKQTGSGRVASPRTNEPLRTGEWRPRPHLRAAEIDALPSGIPVAGVGNRMGLGGKEGRG